MKWHKVAIDEIHLENQKKILKTQKWLKYKQVGISKLGPIEL